MCCVLMDYLVSVIDGHFLSLARPGGDGCKKANHYYFHTYNRHNHLHGLKFLSVVFPCGICIHFGQWTGNRHDAGALRQSKVSHCTVLFAFFIATLTLCAVLQIITVMREVYVLCGIPYLIFGDSAVPLNMHMQLMLKGRLDKESKCFNALMA